MLIILVLLITLSPFVFRSPKNAQVTINGRVFSVEVARTDAEKAKGLSGRDYLDANSGMLFVFPAAEIWPFWMKDTKIPLDIIYVNDSKIIEMTTLQPQNSDDIPKYSPTQKVQYVLELNANSGFKVGDVVKIEL